MSVSFSNMEKAKKLRGFFQQYGRIYIVVDATSDDVRVPDFLRGDPALRLVLNVRMPQAIHIHDDVVESDFSFSGTIHTCHVPMAYIWAAYLPEGDLEQGIVWEEDVPETIRAVMNAAKKIETEPVDAEEKQTTETIAEKPEEPAGRKVRHLRVVK
ncbi:MAG: ClpXP protease specificity-enhancing factor SspB [Mariprofundaceae bacterium]